MRLFHHLYGMSRRGVDRVFWRGEFCSEYQILLMADSCIFWQLNNIVVSLPNELEALLMR